MLPNLFRSLLLQKEKDVAVVPIKKSSSPVPNGPGWKIWVFLPVPLDISEPAPASETCVVQLVPQSVTAFSVLQLM